MTAACPCCGGSGVLDGGRPLCTTAIGRRDTRSPRMLRQMARLQQLALRGVAYTSDGQLLPEHNALYVDYETGQVRQ